MFDIGWLLQHKTSCCISDRCKSLLSTKTSSHTVRMHHDEIFPGFMHIKIESRIRQLNSGLFVCRTLNLLQQCKNYSKLRRPGGAGDRGLTVNFTFYFHNETTKLFTLCLWGDIRIFPNPPAPAGPRTTRTQK